MAEPIKMFVGCDIGDRKSDLCVLDGGGTVVESVKVKTEAASIRDWFAKRPHALVVIEVGTHSRWFSRVVETCGHEVVVANPRRVQLIAKSRRKSDQRDAELLARLGRFDPNLLSPIQHRSDDAQADLVLLRSRDTLVRERTRLANHLRGIVKPFGLRFPPCKPENLPKHVADSVPAYLSPALEPVLKCLEAIALQIDECDERLVKRAAEAYPETLRLNQINGVGPVTSLAFVLTLEDPRRFRNSRAVGAFLGLTAARHQSGDSDPECRISKEGDPYVRRLLVQCAQYILFRGPDSDLKRWGLVLAARGKKNAKKRAVVAVARKLAVLLHRLWSSGEAYVPLGYNGPKKVAA